MVVGFGLALVAPAQALGADRYVDVTGTDAGANNCTLPAAPCATVSYALTVAAAGEEVKIDNGTYHEAVQIDGGRSLVYQDFIGTDSGPALIDGDAGTAVTVQASGAGHIRGLQLRGNTNGVVLNGPAEVDHNMIDDPDATSGSGVMVGAPGSLVHDNTIKDPAPGPGRTRIGVILQSGGAATIADNTIRGMVVGLSGFGASPHPLVAGNLIEGTSDPSATGFGNAIRLGCCVAAGSGITLRENTIRAPTNSTAKGMVLNDPATLERNEITGHAEGIFVGPDTQGVTLEGDRIWGNSNTGVNVSDNNPVPKKTAVTATNVTVFGNGIDFFVQDSSLTLDSSVAGTMYPQGAASCAITFSRGDVAGTDASGCDGFQTTAAPGFVNAGTGNFHLTAGSAMLDAGNPADPGVGAIDFEGDPRAVDGVIDCDTTERRDIGADEYVPAPLVLDCEPPETAIESGPQEGQAISEVTPTIGFSSDDPDATFQCSIDGGLFAGCSHVSYHILGPLEDGEHSFAVRAKDTADNADPTPAHVSFTVDTVAPDTTLTKKPPKRSKRKSATFRFTADDETPVTFECNLDSSAYAPCDSPYKVNVKPGKHKLLVRATDEAGNPEAQPASYAFKRIKK